MKFKKKMNYKIGFLPNKRCRKEQETGLSKEVELELQDLTEDEFPVAFVVHDYAKVYDGAVDFFDFDYPNQGEYRLYEEEVRAYKGQLYKPIRVKYGVAVSTCFEKNTNRAISLFGAHFHENEAYSSESIILYSCEDEMYAKLQKGCEKYKFFDGKIWILCGEPHYWTMEGIASINWGTFTDYRIPEVHIRGAQYFSALERERFLASVNESYKKLWIEVKMPEMVKLYHPKFLNVSVCCQAHYNSRIELPRNFTGDHDDAVAYAKNHMDEIHLGNLEYIPDSDTLDEENCFFDE